MSHAKWDPNGLTPPRTDQDNIKNRADPTADDYCGVSRGDTSVMLQSGATVNLTWQAPIYHQGYFRIALSEMNDSNFTQHILLDNYAEVSGKVNYEYEVNLPDIECQACTLQLVQVMLDQNNSRYYSCSDIRLTRSGTLEPDETYDDVPPEPVSGVKVTKGLSQVFLEWQNPENDFFRVVVVQSSQPLNRDPQTGLDYLRNDTIGNGVVVFNGELSSRTIRGLDQFDTYYYTVFSYDLHRNYSQAQQVKVDPGYLRSDSFNVNLRLEQDDVIRAGDVDQFGSEILIQANVTGTGRYDYVWSSPDFDFTDLDSDEFTLTLDPSSLSVGQYRVVVTVIDQSDRSQIEQSVISLDVLDSEDGADIETTAVPSVAVDESEPLATQDSVGGLAKNVVSQSGGGSIFWLLLIVLPLLFLENKSKKSGPD